MANGNENQQYSEVVREFCLTVHYYSPAAYRYLRNKFKKNLPAVRTLQCWYSSIESEPGLTEAAFETLKQKVNEAKLRGEQLKISMFNDEMHIYKKSQWDPSKKEFTGLISCGTLREEDQGIRIASNALVYLIVGQDFKLPIAYFLINGLCAEERAEMAKDIIMRVNETGAIITSFIFDGLITNISVVKELGVNYEAGKPFFPDPSDETRNIHVFLDNPHMLKLARNCFASKQLYVDNKPINWDLIVRLHEKQKQENLNLGNKLTRRHIEWYNKKMNVRLATETISCSIANSLQQLNRDGVVGFEDTETTVEFIRVFDTLFDIMNSKAGHEGKNFKIPICATTKDRIFEYFDYAKAYLMKIKIREVKNNVEIQHSVFKSDSFTPFFGYLHNMTSFKNMFNEYYASEKLYTFICCQDHIETFFGCIRRMQGCSDNPTAVQFAAAYRKLLVFNGIQGSESGNCINNSTNILTVSSRRSTQLLNVTSMPPNEILDNILDDADDVAYIQNSNGTVFTQPQSSERKYREHKRAYLASLTEIEVCKAIKRCHKKSCQDCITVFLENRSVCDSFVELTNKSKTMSQPCESTVSIINTIEKTLEKFPNRFISFRDTYNMILANIDLNEVYEASNFNEHDNPVSNPFPHKQLFVGSIIEKCLSLKSKYIGDRLTLERQGECIRHKNLKKTHREGQ